VPAVLVAVDRADQPDLFVVTKRRLAQPAAPRYLLDGESCHAERTHAPHPSVYREIQRAEQAGLVTTRKVGNTRLVRANTDSPYYAGLAEVLTRAFGVPAVLAEVLSPLQGITEAYVYGSWAARHAGLNGPRPVGDIDVLVLGDPDRDQFYIALSDAEGRLGRPVQATIREPGWLESGTGAFHDTLTSRPMLRLDTSRD
jgi:predicted nucleotidyltransferase